MKTSPEASSSATCPGCGVPIEEGLPQCPHCHSSWNPVPGIEQEMPEGIFDLPQPEAEQIVGGGRFKLIQKLGQGGMGVVWLAVDQELAKSGENSLVALKFLCEDIRSNPAAVQMMRTEVLNGRKLHHPNIVSIYEFYALKDEAPFVCMEYIEGETLTQVAQTKPDGVFRWPELMPFVLQMCQALDYAHREGVIHLDFKPSNMMITRRGVLKLTDFGLAKVFFTRDNILPEHTRPRGTLPYMSPQQLAGITPRPADDIYSLGATLFDLLTGTPPFCSKNVEELTYQIREERPPSLAQRLADLGRRNDIPAHVRVLVSACLEKDTLMRPQAVKDVGGRLMHKAMPDLLKPEGPAGIGGAAAENGGEAAEPVESRKPSLRTWISYSVLAVTLLALGWVLLSGGEKGTDMRGKLKRIYDGLTGTPTTNQPIIDLDYLTKRLTASLQITIDPPGSQVVLYSGDAEKWRTNLAPRSFVIPNLATGVYTLEATKEGYLERRQDITLASTQREAITVTLSSKQIFLALAAANFDAGKPPDYKILLSGAVIAEGRCAGGGQAVIPLSWPGQYLVEITDSDGKTFRKRVEVRPGENPVAFDLAQYSLKIYANKPAALWRADASGIREQILAENSERWLRVGVGERGFFFQDDLIQGDYNYQFAFFGHATTNYGITVTRSRNQELNMQLLPAIHPTPGLSWTNSAGMRLVFVKDFWMSRTETTLEQYRWFAEGTRRTLPTNMVCVTAQGWKLLPASHWKSPGFAQGADHPVVGVSWEDAMAYCQWLTAAERARGSLASNQYYRLPKDAEWSLAAGSARYPWGDPWDPNHRGNYAGREVTNANWFVHWGHLDGQDDFPRTAPAGHGAFPPNANGLCDMGGNVAEWGWDDYEPKLNDPAVLARIPSLQEGGNGPVFKVIRGASWYDGVSGVEHGDDELLTNTRQRARPDEHNDRTGFRVALVEEKE